MNRLGARISALMIIAIIVLAAAATAMALRIAGPTGGGAGGAIERRLASALALVSRALDLVPYEERERFLGTGFMILSAEPPDGALLETYSRSMKNELLKQGVTGDVRVVMRDDGPPMPSLRLADGRWLTAGPGIPRPLWEWSFFVFLMALVTLGVGSLAIFAVMRATRPHAVLERAVAAAGPEGDFVVLPETGPMEVRATARAINTLSTRLRSAMESRMRLVAAAGHDLRTPLTRLRLRAEFLPEEAERACWLKDIEEIDRIADSAIRLVREEVDPDSQAVERIDLIAEQVVEELAEIGLSVSLARAEPCAASVRPLAMKRAIRNLAVNAATHGEKAVLSVRALRGAAIVTIEDEGPGIPPDLLERAFEPFFRVDPGRRAAVPGAGLGLAIAREIVLRNGGSLKIANRPFGGLLQVISLKLAK